MDGAREAGEKKHGEAEANAAKYPPERATDFLALRCIGGDPSNAGSSHWGVATNHGGRHTLATTANTVHDGNR